ncbi:hypothetical protein Tco_1460355 [Tanacetum coccineum]
MDDLMKSFITETINAAMAASMESVNRSFQEQLERTNTAMNNSVNGVCLRQDTLVVELQRTTGEIGTSTTLNRLNNTCMSRISKIEFPVFYGDDPTGWVYRCNQFFKVDDILPEDKALLKRFSSCYEDPMSDLKNIRQQGGLVQVYIDVFDLIMTKVDVPKTQVVSFFLGGLDKEIKMTVRMFKPQSLADAYLYNNYGRNSGSQAQIVHYTPPRPKPIYNNAPYKKQLTRKELDEKRAKNQCFYCDQKYVPGHKCSGRLLDYGRKWRSRGRIG